MNRSTAAKPGTAAEARAGQPKLVAQIPQEWRVPFALWVSGMPLTVMSVAAKPHR
jgi:hypothetical protein